MHNSRLIAKQQRCLILQPCLADKLGRSPSLFLQQVHYWMTCNKKGIGKVIGQRRWIYNSMKEWALQLRLSERQASRIINQLKDTGILLVDRLNHCKSDRTNWYSINYQALERLIPDLTWQVKADPVSSSKDSYTPSDKMSGSLGQNDLTYNKKSEITSKNKTISSEKAKVISKKPVTKQVNVIKKENKLTNNLAIELLEIWNQTVGQEGNLIQLTKKRAQHLVAAFKYRFESNQLKWKHFCQQVTTSDFLMGKVKSTFKASLDWVLKFDTIQRILEGDFGVKNSFFAEEEQGLQNKENLDREIQSNSEEHAIKLFRRSILQTFGVQVYQSWFADMAIKEEEGGLVLTAKSRFISDYIQTHYLEKLRSSSIYISLIC